MARAWLDSLLFSRPWRLSPLHLRSFSVRCLVHSETGTARVRQCSACSPGALMEASIRTSRFRAISSGHQSASGGDSGRHSDASPPRSTPVADRAVLPAAPGGVVFVGCVRCACRSCHLGPDGVALACHLRPCAPCSPGSDPYSAAFLGPPALYQPAAAIGSCVCSGLVIE